MSAILRLTTGVVYVRSWSGTFPGGTLAPDTIVLDSTNQDISLSRGAANRLDLATGDSFSLVDGSLTVNKLAIGVTTAAGLTLQNTTAAALGAQQYSPGLSLIGQGRKTDSPAASQAVEYRFEVRPVQGAAAPTATLAFMRRINVGAWTDSLTIAGGGDAILSGQLTATTGLYTGDNRVIGWEGDRVLMRSAVSGVLRIANTAEDGFTSLLLGPSGGATSINHLQKKVTGIADNTATNVFTVTIPNANHAAAIRVMFLSSNGSTDAFESSRCASGMVVVARTTGANAVVTAATIDDAAIATVASGATHTLTYGVSAISGAADASNTATIQVTIDDSGNLGSNQVVAIAELLNSEATGVTIA